MKNIISIILFSLLIIPCSYGAEESIRDFAQGLEKLFSIKAKRTLEVGDVTHFAPQFIPSNTAEASYNPVLNTIFLKKENLVSQGAATYFVKSINELRKNEPLTYSTKISTIFHELGHAEMDQFILKGLTLEDRALAGIFKNEFSPWVKKNYPGVNPTTLFQEIYGYYRGGVIEVLFQDKSTIEILNGWNTFQHRCFNSIYLKQAVQTLSREEYGQILYTDNDPAWTEKYMNRFMPRYVFIRGKDVDLYKNSNDPFKETWKKALWSYFSFYYQLPSNMKELAIYFRNNHEDRKSILECRNKFWDEYHSAHNKI